MTKKPEPDNGNKISGKERKYNLRVVRVNTHNKDNSITTLTKYYSQEVGDRIEIEFENILWHNSFGNIDIYENPYGLIKPLEFDDNGLPILLEYGITDLNLDRIRVALEKLYQTQSMKVNTDERFRSFSPNEDPLNGFRGFKLNLKRSKLFCPGDIDGNGLYINKEFKKQVETIPTLISKGIPLEAFDDDFRGKLVKCIETLTREFVPTLPEMIGLANIITNYPKYGKDVKPPESFNYQLLGFPQHIFCQIPRVSQEMFNLGKAAFNRNTAIIDSDRDSMSTIGRIIQRYEKMPEY